jgi:hypothetical protein
MNKLALQAILCYNKPIKSLCLSGVTSTPRREFNLYERRTMDTLPQKPPQRKPYVYFLKYPEPMGGTIFYIGKGIGRRINIHEVEARSSNVSSCNSYKVSVIRQIWSQGEQITKTKYAYFDTDDEAYIYEFALIFFMQGYGNLTNINVGGIGGRSNVYRIRGKPHSEEWKQKASAWLTGRPVSEETKRQISESTKGRKHSDEAIQMRREALRGRPQSEEANKKNSETHKGKSPSAEHRRKLSEANKGKVYSEERRRNMSEGRKRAQEQRKL